MENDSLPILQVVNIRRTFPGVVALSGVSLDLYPGEVHALVGENGAGKSTLIKIICGALAPESGELFFQGREVRWPNPVAARAQGMVTVHQEPELFPTLSVAENMALATGLPLRGFGLVDWNRVHRRARETVRQMGETIDVRQPASQLSVAHRQMIQVAAAIRQNAKVVVLDEPTSALSGEEARWLFQQIARLKADGAGILYISHRQEEIFRLADRITVLRDGLKVWTRARQVVGPDEVIEAMVGRPAATLAASPSDARASSPTGQAGPVRFQVSSFTDRGGRFRQLDLEARAGEIVGIYGLVGAGRSEFARAVFGLRPAGGLVRIDGNRCAIGRPREALNAGIAYVPEDRLSQGLCPGLPVRSNAVLSTLQRWTRGFLASRTREQQATRQIAGQLEVRYRSTEQPVQQLSGGNQQKVVLGRWLLAQPKILILDEPTRGVDVGAKAEIHRHLRRLAGEGCAILLISSELPEVLEHSDRVVVFREGEIAGEFDPGQAGPARHRRRRPAPAESGGGLRRTAPVHRVPVPGTVLQRAGAAAVRGGAWPVADGFHRGVQPPEPADSYLSLGHSGPGGGRGHRGPGNRHFNRLDGGSVGGLHRHGPEAALFGRDSDSGRNPGRTPGRDGGRGSECRSGAAGWAAPHCGDPGDPDHLPRIGDRHAGREIHDRTAPPVRSAGHRPRNGFPGLGGGSGLGRPAGLSLDGPHPQRPARLRAGLGPPGRRPAGSFQGAPLAGHLWPGRTAGRTGRSAPALHGPADASPPGSRLGTERHRRGRHRRRGNHRRSGHRAGCGSGRPPAAIGQQRSGALGSVGSTDGPGGGQPDPGGAAAGSGLARMETMKERGQERAGVAAAPPGGRANPWIFGLLPWCLLALALLLVFSQVRRPALLVEVWVPWIEVGTLAFVMTAIILTGGIDLSVGSMVALTGMVQAVLWQDWGWSIQAAAGAALLTGALAGGFNGLLVVAGLSPLVATLATMALYRGLAITVAGGDRIAGFPQAFLDMGRFLGVPSQFWLAGLVFLAMFLLVHHTRFGRWCFAMGDNRPAARFAAVPVNKVDGVLYTINGLAAASVAVLGTMRHDVSIPDAHIGTELQVIACVVVGGTLITGGRGSVPRSFLGLAVISHLDVGLQFLSSRLSWLTAESRLIVIGILLILVAVWNQRSQKEG